MRRFDLAAPLFAEAQLYHKAGYCSELANNIVQAIKYYGLTNKEYDLMRILKKLKESEKKKIEYEVKNLASKMWKENCYRTAAVCFAFVGNKISAAFCLAMVGETDKAVKMIGKNIDYHGLYRCFERQKLFNEGMRLFVALWQRHDLRKREHLAIAENLEALLKTYWSRQLVNSGDTRIAELIMTTDIPFSGNFLMAILEQLREYDHVRERLYDMQHWRSDRFLINGRVWTNEVFLREQRGEYEAAGFRYLCINQLDEARRCYSKVEIDRKNYKCFMQLGLAKKAIPYLLSKNLYREAAELSEAVGDYKGAADIYLKAQLPREAARVHEQTRDYASALAIYINSKDKKNQAKVLEKMGRYKEAANIWKELGFDKEYKRCCKKAEKNPFWQSMLFGGGS